MNIDALRHIVEQEVPGFELSTEGVHEPDLFLKAFLQKLVAEGRAQAGKLRHAEYVAQQKALDCAALRRNAEESEQAQKQLCTELSSYKRKVADYEAKIAFLGSRWEELTGEVNKLLHDDPDTRARQCKGEMEAAKTMLFDTELALKMQQRKAEAVERKCREQEDAIERWSAELISSNRRVEDLQVQNLHLQSQVADLKDKYASAAKSLEAKHIEVRQLVGQLEVSEIQLKDTNSRVEQLNLRCVKVGRDLSTKEKSLDEVKVLVQYSADDRSILNERVTKLEGELKFAREKLVEVERRAAEKESEARALEEQLMSKTAELNNVGIEFASAKSVNQRLTKDVNVRDRKLKEEQSEIEALRIGLAKASRDLVYLQEKFQASEAEIERLTKDLEVTNSAHKNSEALVSSIGEEKQLINGRLTTTTTEFQQLQVAANRLEKDLRSSQMHVKSLENNIDQLNASVERSASEIKQLEDKCRNAEAEKRAVFTELRSAQDQLRQAQGSMDELEKSYQRVSSDLQISKQNLDSAGNAVATLTKDVRTRSSQVTEYETELNASRVQIQKLSLELSRMEEQCQDVQAQNETLQSNIKDKERLLLQAEETAKALAAANDRINFEMGLLRKQKDIESQQARSLEREVTGKDATIHDKNSDISVLRDRYDRLGDEYRTSQERLQASEKHVIYLEQKVKELECQLVQADVVAFDRERAYVKVQGELGLVRQDYEVVGAHTKALARQIRASEGIVSGFEEEVSNYKISITSLAGNLNEKNRQMSLMRESIQELEERLAASVENGKLAKVRADQFEAASKRIAAELEASQLRLRESDVLVRKLTTDLRLSKEHLQDSYTERSVLSSNVNRLMEEFKKINGVK